MPIEVNGLLVKVRAGGAFAGANLAMLGKAEVILDVPPGSTGGMGLAADEHTQWVMVDAGDQSWDRAHMLMAQGFSANANNVVAAEPDVVQQFPTDRAAKTAKCQNDPPKSTGGLMAGPHFAWHLDDNFSGLRSARASVADIDQQKVLIAHLDTGYDPNHKARPANILTALERNFTGEGQPNSAQDVTPGGIGQNPGHGPATIVLLAGGDPGGLSGGITGALGGIPNARILPIRIADSVVRLSTSTMVKGFAYALDNKAHVLSMSMGGLASSAVADVVNQCYEAGMVMVAAAGNFIGGVPSPRSIVYPARMRRVIAATGVMANGAAYFDLDVGTMQGCHGPDAKMDTALAGWTPNTPWAELGCLTNVDQNGSGTSSATPQVAATAALWIARNFVAHQAYPQAWQRGEAVRQALFEAGRRTTPLLNAAAVRELLGQGTVDALRALEVKPAAAQSLTRAPVASASLAWLRLLSGTGVGVATAAASPRAAMLELEILQLTQLDAQLGGILPDPESGTASDADRKRFLEAVRDSNMGSKALNRAIDVALGIGTTLLPTLPLARQAPRPPAPISPQRPGPPENRRLRIYALDPSLGGTLSTYAEQIATVEVPYEVDQQGHSILGPGPVGEYLEVVDVDPASNQFYQPVNLEDPRLMLTDGLDPSEGNPQFHQQMVYAVGMRTITSFENALGRRVLWALHNTDGRHRYEYVQRLRIYPHALRAKNSYYSPDKIALLLGYFPSDSTKDDSTAPGTMVFSCLSADIVAHEMTHALLDGYTPGYREASNPDVGAFHEAFADMVALFQHFQYRDLVRRQIANTRGDLGAAYLLSGLAKQFGEGLGKHGALRDYLRKYDDVQYKTSFEVHERGSLLVLAVYQAFEAIFDMRTRDLIRLATGGSGVLAQGAIHPDLIERLTEEACVAASQVLRMCIRALDYCPPTDITFSSFLRGLITADVETVHEEKYGYRIAFLEKFRGLDLLPTNLRTMSVETLCWQRPWEVRNPHWLKPAVNEFKIDWRSDLDRATIFRDSRARCAALHNYLLKQMARDKESRDDICRTLRLQPNLQGYDENGVINATSDAPRFEVRNVRAARRVLPNGRPAEEIIVTLMQRKPVPFYAEKPDAGSFWYHGGSTVVINPNKHGEPEIKYVISKPIYSPDRLTEELAFRTNPPSSGTRSMYFSDHGLAAREPFAALHASED
ncbi:S8 family serine peptidase [Mesorhizobium australicum]|uniref:S8 family serine peptidase n=1 Tax=Mesorhizobium australicum TaxID=536018 RepID=UPI00333DB6A2